LCFLSCRLCMGVAFLAIHKQDFVSISDRVSLT
jgi:hypothetical protein